MPFARLFQPCIRVCLRLSILLAALCAMVPAAHADATATPAQGETFRLQLAADGAQAADADTGTVQFIGTATVIIRFQGFTILTDPNFLHKGDHVTWKSHGGPAEGVVEKEITTDTEAAGRTVRASKDEPQYLVKSEKSGGEAVHKPSALHTD